MKPWLFKFSLFALSLTSLGALVEGILQLLVRVREPISAPSEEREPIESTSLMRRDPMTGWIPREGTSRKKTGIDGQTFAVRINSTGQRGPELPPNSPATQRILFLGDSFTMADQVAETQTFVHLVDRHLESRLGREVETINGGVNGFSTYQELAYYRYFGRPLRPDLVVLCFFSGNDYRDNMVATRQGHRLNPVLVPSPERYWRDNDRLLRDSDFNPLKDPLSDDVLPQPHSPWAEILQRRSLLARLLSSRYYKLKGWLNTDLGLIDLHHQYYFYEIGFYQQRDDGVFSTARELALECINQLQHQVAADQAELLVVILPSRNQVSPALWQQTLGEIKVDAQDLAPLDMTYPNNLITDYCRQRGIPSLDLTTSFLAAPEVQDMYLTVLNDGHFSPLGHQLAAKKITSFILARNQSLQNPALNLFRQGQMHYNRGQDRQAAAAFAKAARLDSNWAAPHLGFGDIFSRQGMSSEAVEAYRSALALNPKTAKAWQGLARALSQTDDIPAALNAWQQALRLRPNWWPYRQALQRLYARAGRQRDADKEQQHLQALFNGPEDIRRGWWVEHIAQATRWMKNGQLQQAEKEFRRAVHFLPSHADEPDELYNMALALKYEDPQRASEFFGEAFARNRKLVYAGLELGLFHAQRGELDQAAQVLDLVVEHAPDWADAWVNRGIVYARQGRYRDAATAWKRALELAPSHPQAKINLDRLRQSGHL
jgi:tetratricopeptide (TPR) repeat protein